jgi:uncharacterized protein
MIQTLATAGRGKTRLRLFAFIATLALCLPLSAQAELASRVETLRPVTIVVFGDSLAEGLWGSLYRRFAREPGIRVVNATRASTGFNADYYDTALDRLLDRGPIDLLVVQTGANDRQRVLGFDGQKAPFGTPRWFELYSQRLNYFFARLQQRRIPVLWVGMPVMRDAPFDGGMRVISRVHQSHAERHGATFLDIVAFTADSEGAYVDRLLGPGGRQRRLRHDDGVHFWELGYDRVAAHVLSTLSARFPRVLPDGRARADMPSHKP